MNAIATISETAEYYRQAIKSTNMDEKLVAATWLWNNDPDYEW